ncbi:unnamed protein product [Brassicogethes aeneus]|uniref:Uncharacterized protein n=1 Tax=Brassicogethes aeneus TaxID=1431903 RepID=A0A9P0FNL5_BRAAE|nr:unnamed protein product [Brassicogethes aeneus]
MLVFQLAIVLSVLCFFNTHAQSSNRRLQEDDPEDRRLNRRRRPCRIGGGKFKHGEGRTFLDWNYQYVNVNYNHNYNIDCSGGGGGKPNKGHHGGGGGGGGFGGFPQTGYFPPPLPPPNPPPVLPPPYYSPPQQAPYPQRPGGAFGNRPFGGLFGSLFQSQSQSQASSNEDSVSQNRPPNVVQGINNAVQNVGMIGQSVVQAGTGIFSSFPQFEWPMFQLPSFDPPQLPSLSEGGGNFGQGLQSFFQGFGDLFNRPASASSPASTGSPSSPPVASPSAPTPVPPTDPDDVIFNDEKPVNEPYDPVQPDAYSNLKPGVIYNKLPNYQNRYEAQKQYNSKYAQNDKFLSPESRSGSRSLRFPE